MNMAKLPVALATRSPAPSMVRAWRWITPRPKPHSWSENVDFGDRLGHLAVSSANCRV